ncbi:MAG: tetratricopeptide repeat protein [Treponema sp.]|nr:tetratricopeptide repeat protein [Treponema sp.]
MSDDGLIREWELFSGKLLAVYPAENEEIPPLAENGKPVFSPDGSKKLFPASDGAVCLVDAATGKELARYYGLNSEWLSIVPEGFYNASFQGAFCFSASLGKQYYRLDQLSGALFRPDLFKVSLMPESEPRISTIAPAAGTFFKKDQRPPLVSLSLEGEKVKIKITEQKGGTGLLAIYRREERGTTPEGEEIPAGFIDVGKTAEKKYTEKGKTCFEITLSPGQGETGISAFNKSNTIESERVWITLPQRQNSSVVEIREAALKALLAAQDGEPAAILEETLSLQSEGELYSAVEVKKLVGEEFNRNSFIKTLDELFTGTEKNDVLILHLQGWGKADAMGNLRIVPVKNADPNSMLSDIENEISGEDILQAILKPSANSLIIMDLLPYVNNEAGLEIALLRFRQRLGPKAMLGTFSGGDSIASVIMEKLSPGARGFTERYVNAAGLLDHVSRSITGLVVFPPREDFRIADNLINAGELKFQTMASGMLKIDQVDKDPIPLIFGDTMNRILPMGSYIIDMIYRNGYRETRTVQLRKKDSSWVIFTYTPPLLVGDFSQIRGGALGINISELNPVNYQRINVEAMESMGMAPYYVAFLSGERFYKDGNYDRAISEYSRSISLKSDYIDAHVSRGNALRIKGDFNRAIEDYNRALSLKNGYAEVYNYRGFIHAKRGDLNRAITDYTQAIRFKTDYADAYFNRAHAHGVMGNWDLSIADNTQVLMFEPSNSIDYRERGNAWNSKGENSRANADYEAAEKYK